MLIELLLIVINIITFSYGNSEVNDTSKNKEFCLYTKNSVIKTINPFYVDLNSDETIYFNTIEEYAKYLGPDWAGVSICGEDTLVNYIGEYFKIVENKNFNKRKRNDEDTTNELPDVTNEDINKSRTVEEYREKYKKLYDDLIRKGIKNVALTSENPAYNPYHRDLIKVKNILYTNVVTTLGTPYELDKKTYEAFLRDNKKNGKEFQECGSFQLSEGSTYTCSIAYTTEIQDTISISNSKGNSYHKSYGKVYSRGDTITDEINKSIELANALSGSKSISASLAEGGSSSIEKIYTVINTKSLSQQNSTEHTVTKSSERSVSHVESEEHALGITLSSEHTDETNWSNTNETSHSLEYSSMDPDDYAKAKNIRDKNEYRKVDLSESNYEKGVGKVDKFVGKVGEKVGDFVNWVKGIFTTKSKRDLRQLPKDNELKINNNDNTNSHYRDNNDNTNSHKQNKHKRQLLRRGGGGGGLTELVDMLVKVRDSNVNLYNAAVNTIGTYGNIMNGYDANRIQRAGINDQYNIALDQENAQYRMAVAGTHSSSNTTSQSWTRGGSKVDTSGWSLANTITSGISNSWTSTFGVSDAYTTGHVETATVEHSISDATSKMLTSNFNKETGWVNEESRTRTTSNGFSFGKSMQVNTNEQTNYDDAIEVSAQNSYEMSNTKSESEILTRSINVVAKDSSCYTVTALPKFENQVTIWVGGSVNKANKVKVTYNKSVTPIEFTGFVGSVVPCNEVNDYQEELVNYDVDRFNFIRDVKSTFDTLESESVLVPGQYLTTTSKSYSFGLLPTGELVLCEGASVKEGCKKVWSNGITTLDPEVDHDLKFFIGANGHLYITAKNIYKKEIEKVNYSDYFIDIMNEYIKMDEEYPDTTLSDHIKSIKNKLYNTNEKIKLEKRKARPHDPVTPKPVTTVSVYHTTTSNASSTEIETSTNDPSNDPSSDANVSTKSNDANDSTSIVSTTTTKSTNPTTSSTTNSTKSNTTETDSTTSSTTTPLSFANPNAEYIIWDSLPKDLPYNVGYPDDKGYYLYIKDEKDKRVGASVVLYDGAGVKIWEIKGKQKDYKGYAFPVEYVYPLSIDTSLNIENDSYYEDFDTHNFYDKDVVKDAYKNSIEMNCVNRMKEDEALVSNNKKYRFYVQDTGNMVIKDNYRTTWSSNTANIELYEGPFSLVFSPLGEFILRDKYDYAIWKSINPILLLNTDDIQSMFKFYLTLSDDGELLVEDQNHNIYWSNWDERVYGSHMRYVNPLKYEITSCNEHLRNKYIYELFAETGLYDYYEDPEHVSTLVKKFYFNNLLPGEALLSDYKITSFLNVTKNDVLLNINDDPVVTLSSCSGNDGIKELRLETDGLKLLCNDNKTKFIAEIKDNKINKYNRLSFEYREGMDKPNLVIYNVKTSEILWKYGGIRYLTELREIDEPKYDDNYDIIKVDNKMTVFDRFVSTNRNYKDKFVYLSSSTGLEFQEGTLLSLYNMYMSKNSFYINDRKVINSSKGMILEYNPISDKLIMANSTNKNIWELYGGITMCDKFISNNNTCNTIYSVNQVLIKNNPVYFNFKGDNLLEYLSPTMSDYITFNLTEYTNIKDPIFAITLAANGNIELNNGQYILHEEYFVPDEYYYLYEDDSNLVLKSSRGEYKWALNKEITNRDYDANAIYIGQSFGEGEMLYCGDYSMIILNGKLLYRDHITKEESEIVLGKQSNNYLYHITVNDDNLTFSNKENTPIFYKTSSKSSKDSVLKCSSERSIVWDDGNGNILWSYPEKPKTTTTTTIPVTTTFSTSYITNYSTEYSTKTETSLVTKTTTTKETYTYVGYTGNLGSKNYLGVNELKEYTTLMARYGGSSKSPSKYIRWLVKSKDDPSVMYLANNDGGFSDYCLNIGKAKDSYSYYLTITKCSKASYLFKYNVPFTEPSGKRITDSPNIGVYNNDGTLFTNKNGAPYCIHYSDTLYISQCRYIDGYPNFKWNRISQKPEFHTETSTKTNVQTSTSYITSSTVIPSVTSTVLTMVITPTPTPNKE